MRPPKNISKWRCRLSAEAKRANIRLRGRDREGVAWNSGTYVKVIWDGKKSVNTYHPLYIEPVRG